MNALTKKQLISKADKLYNKAMQQGNIIDCLDMDGIRLAHCNTKGERILRRCYRIYDTAYGTV